MRGVTIGIIGMEFTRIWKVGKKSFCLTISCDGYFTITKSGILGWIPQVSSFKIEVVIISIIHEHLDFILFNLFQFYNEKKSKDLDLDESKSNWIWQELSNSTPFLRYLKFFKQSNVKNWIFVSIINVLISDFLNVRDAEQWTE